MDLNNTRIAEMRTYLLRVIDELLKKKDYQININFLPNDIGDFSLDRIPIEYNVQKWIVPIARYREVYELRSRKAYNQAVLENLASIGFFERFEEVIYSNNRKGILPNIDGIEKIECLNVGSLSIAETQEAIFSIQIQITYRKGV